jgi:hypothetical protein
MVVHQGEVEVNGLTLPAGLVRALREGRWRSLRRSASLAAVFGSEPVRPKFFTLAEIRAVNLYWKDEADPLYLGQADSSRHPGDIDPKRSLIIAELGPDQLIALDYRRSAVPEVVFASDHVRSPWLLVSGSVEELLEELAASDQRHERHVVLALEPEHEFTDRGGHGWPPGTPAALYSHLRATNRRCQVSSVAAKD